MCVNGTGSRDAIKSANESKSSENDSHPSYNTIVLQSVNLSMYEINRGYYMAAWKYKFYLISEGYFQHERTKFVSSSGM